MEYRNLGRTGVKVSPLCLGTMNFGSRTPEDEAIRMIDQAIEAGLNFIDTANLYGDANEKEHFKVILKHVGIARPRITQKRLCKVYA